MTSPVDEQPKTVYCIVERLTGKIQAVYSRAYHDGFFFESPSQARSANVHGIYEDKKKYSIAKYEVTYKLLDISVDGTE